MARQWPGWRIWTSAQGGPVATRRGTRQPIDDGVWARTLICDDWIERGRQLAEQAANDMAAT
jgi:hypothetical protein